MDGGLLDTTGIVPHLREKVDTIIASYNNNNALEDLNSTFAFLFGVTTNTDTMNSLEGPTLAQVFFRPWVLVLDPCHMTYCI